jgi:hypothetical protein
MIYVIVFAISCFFTYLAEVNINSIKGRNNKISYIFSTIAIIIPSVFGGLRDSGIGTDTLVYVDIIFDQILRIDSLEELFDVYISDSIINNHIEFLYLLLNYIISLFSDNVNWVYFFTTFITVMFFYLAAYDNRKRASMCLSMLFFFCLFYNQSFNMVRQSIALAMTIYAYKHIEAKNWIKIIIWSVIIINVHSSGIGFILLFVIHYVCHLKNVYTRVFLLSILLAGCISIFIMLDHIVKFMVDIGIIPIKFLVYISKGTPALIESVFIMHILLLLLIYAVKLILMQHENLSSIKRENLSYYAYNKLIGVLLFNLSVIAEYLYRMSLYINVVDGIIIPKILRLLPSKTSSSIILHISIILLLIVIWYWAIIINNGNETYPYTSRILGIN